MGSIVTGFHEISTIDAVEASGLHHHLQVFVQNRVGDGESGCISRNDGVLVPLHLLVGCTSFGRDVHYFSTPLDTRPDFTGLYNSVQLIYGSLISESSLCCDDWMDGYLDVEELRYDFIQEKNKNKCDR